MENIKVKFWGVRGSIPAPLTPAQVEAKIRAAVGGYAATLQPGDIVHHPSAMSASAADFVNALPFVGRSTYGGNTTCVEVRCGDLLFVLDMGSGLRELGNALMPRMVPERGLRGIVLQSHMHWDHIQGFPFFGPSRMPRNTGMHARFLFMGGVSWQRPLEEVLRWQMDPPVFPVTFEELEKVAMSMTFRGVHDGLVFYVPQTNNHAYFDEWLKRDPSVPPTSAALGGSPMDDVVKITARKLNHPQETYGYRIEYRGECVAFCTDHEPHAGTEPHWPLVDLARGADVWITDCQYSHDEYAGRSPYRFQKQGWGHSFPEYIASVARAAAPKKVATTHHDPMSSDQRVAELAAAVQADCGIETVPAWEGLEL